ncbi:MAG: ABC transporter ATP-binding protein [Lautropia sp.]
MSSERDARGVAREAEAAARHAGLETPSTQYSVSVRGVDKCYHIYAQPRDRLLQFVVPRLRRLAGLEAVSYGREFWALRDVSFDVRRGETVGIIGKNGAGKSTLLQILCGTLTPTAGTVEVSGRVAALLELGAGFDVEFSGRENIYLNGSLLGLDRAEIDARFDDIAAFADIGAFLEQPVKTYSSGMFVRLAFAISAFVSPEVLIVDEALAVGDFSFNLKCLKRLEQLKDDGCSIVFVSHDIGLVQKLCERTLYLERGQTVMFGDSAAATSRYITDQTSVAGAARPHGPAATPAVREEAGDALEPTGTDAGAAAHASADGWPTEARIQAFRRQLRGTNTGSKAVTIELAEVRHDGRGAVVVFDARIELVVYLLAHEAITDLALSVYVIDERGQLLIGCNTAVERVAMPALAAGDRRCVRFGFANRLREGNYGITIIANRYVSATNFEYLHYLEPALELRTIAAPGQERWSIYSPVFEIAVESPGGADTTDPAPGPVASHPTDA